MSGLLRDLSFSQLVLGSFLFKFRVSDWLRFRVSTIPLKMNSSGWTVATEKVRMVSQVPVGCRDSSLCSSLDMPVLPGTNLTLPFFPLFFN